MPPLRRLAALALLFLLLAPARAQTTVGCDPRCPPLGVAASAAHLCPGAAVDAATAARRHAICHPTPTARPDLALEEFRRRGRVTVLANYYTGCAAGRREAGAYAALAQRVHDATGGRVTFVTSLKGGGDCALWAGIYRDDAVGLGGAAPTTMPLTISDDSNALRDRFFTPPYPHPSYIVLDENLEVTYKSVGPCCGYAHYYDCTDEVAAGLDRMLTDEIYKVYDRQAAKIFDGDGDGDARLESTGGTDTATDGNDASEQSACQATEFSDWSACSRTCGDGGVQFRHRAHPARPTERRPCPAGAAAALPACAEQCVAELGDGAAAVTVVAAGLRSPRDLAFHPTPGVHLGVASEGRSFNPLEGEELWVVNGANHSVSIVAAVGTPDQTTVSRRDRGYYHYMNNVTALAFNAVGDAPRTADQDTFNYFALCNDNLNDYAGAKEPNYFMGPTLYDTDTVGKAGGKNTVNRLGEDCSDPADQCFFLHADMLHEAPACLGLAHDPERLTAFGTVYWAFDATGDNGGAGGQLVRFDFSQPHGPGSMDHSIAAVRRYPEVRLYRGAGRRQGHHAGMVVHPETRVLYVANPGKGTVVAVRVDTGRYSRTAREEYPIFSNRLPSFEYSIYECVEQEVFARGLEEPSGLALSRDGTTLFVAESGGRVTAYEVESGVALRSLDLAPLGYAALGGLAVSPNTGQLYFVDMDANQVVRIDGAQDSAGECVRQSRVNAEFRAARETARTQVESECGLPFSLTRDYACRVDGAIPNGTLFEQVHADTGYASDDPAVQAMAGMDAAAALLANRTDCGYASALNLDALLLGGYYCHVCLPRGHGASCDAGGACANVQWRGFTCDNEYYVDLDAGSAGAPALVVSSPHHRTTYPRDAPLALSRGVTYRFTVRTGAGQPVSIGTVPEFASATSPPASPLKSLFSESSVSSGPLLLTIDDTTPDCLYMATPRTTQPIVLAVGGAPECPRTTDTTVPGDHGNGELPAEESLLPEAGTSAGSPNTGNEVPGEDSTGSDEVTGEDNGGWFVTPEAESSAGSAVSVGGLCSALVIVLLVVNQ